MWRAHLMTYPRGYSSVMRVVRSLALSAALVVGAAGLGSLAACSSGGGAGGVSGATAASSVPTNGATLDAPAFAAALKRPGTVVLDVRTADEFASGHLAGAHNLDVNAADFAAKVGALPKDVPYAVYCRSGNRSATALAVMKQLGFTQTYHLGGGIGAWTSAGGQVVTG